jgi:hypothetical protein
MNNPFEVDNILSFPAKFDNLRIMLLLYSTSLSTDVKRYRGTMLFTYFFRGRLRRRKTFLSLKPASVSRSCYTLAQGSAGYRAASTWPSPAATSACTPRSPSCTSIAHRPQCGGTPSYSFQSGGLRSWLGPRRQVRSGALE